MAQQLVRVTLEQPWSGSPYGKDVFGQRVESGQLPLVITGDRDGNVLQRLDQEANTFAKNHVRPIDGITEGVHQTRRWVPTIYVFDATDENKSSFVMPDFVAKQWFGDWTYPENQTDPQRSYLESKGQELHRIVQIWGGFRYRKLDAPVRMLGELDMRPIAPPPIPHVAVRLLDVQGKVLLNDDKSEWVYRPWEHFDLWGMCQPPSVDMPVQPSILTPSAGDMQRMIAEAVAAQVNAIKQAIPKKDNSKNLEALQKARRVRAANREKAKVASGTP